MNSFSCSPLANKLAGYCLITVSALLFQCYPDRPRLDIRKGSTIVLIGNNLGSRMTAYGHFETELQLRFPDSFLRVRNMCDGGNTAGFRPHSSRKSPWAFPGAEKFQTELANFTDSQGSFETEDEWLTRLNADIIMAFFGYNESFGGKEGLENFKDELNAFVAHTMQKKYNGKSTVQLVLISPTAFEDLTGKYDLPKGDKENENLRIYTEAMREVAEKHRVLFIDVFSPSKAWMEDIPTEITIDGFQLNDDGYQKLSAFLVDALVDNEAIKNEAHRTEVNNAVIEKDWMWLNDFKIPNGVHAYGRRYLPFGPDNYPAEIKKIREMTAVRDTAIWRAANGIGYDIVKADSRTSALPQIVTNYKIDGGEKAAKYLYGQDAINSFTMARGYQIELFASEKEFPDLANPVQISFDNKGRLWVATMPTYPHYRPGDPKPNDKLIIFEDTNHDGKADRQKIFAEGLHLPLGFEIAPEGVYVSQGTNLVLLTDADGDDRADKKEIILSGFDDHDTHHCIHAFTADPTGAIYMGEGVFLHSNVETPYGPIRGSTGGFYRYEPRRKKLVHIAHMEVTNPWGIAFDTWGQAFYLETSSPELRWLLPSSIKPRYGVATEKSSDLLEPENRVRPTSGLEFVSSRHFPEEVQGDILMNNTIGFLGTKQHALFDEGTGYKAKFRQDLVRSSDPNFRPVDLEFAPDGSLYLADWHNVLIGHMQHNARDPLRDHVHGRIYRITYPSRPLITPPTISGASIDELLNCLKLPEGRTRYRARRELRGRDSYEVLQHLTSWVNQLDKNDASYEHHLLEALWVSSGANKIDQRLIQKLIHSEDFHVRSAAIEVLRYSPDQVSNVLEILQSATKDSNGRVRLEAIAAASWLPREDGLKVLKGVNSLDKWTVPAYETAIAHLSGKSREEKKDDSVQTLLKGNERDLFVKGRELYSREGYCITCHQPDGKGLSAAGFPPLANTRWVTGSEERLIKIVLHGLYGPITVNGKGYGGQVPMTPFKAVLTDDEVAAVLTYIRNSFGNRESPVSPSSVAAVRASTKDRTEFYTASVLLVEHPMEAN